MRRYNRLQEILDARGIKKNWLADQVGTSASIVSRWCLNKSQPRIPMLYRVAEVLGCSVHEILLNVPEEGE